MELRSRGRAVLVGIGVLLLGVILQQFAIIPALVVDPAIAFDPAEATRLGVMILLPLNFIALGVAGVIYMRLADRGWEWIDLYRPGKRDIAWMVGGTILVLIGLILIGILAQALEIEPPEQALTVLIGEDAVLILFMIATVWLLNAPMEEFLFRNVIQKRLYDAFSGISAVIITSILFGFIHVFTLVVVGEGAIDVFIPILGIFIGSLVMGYAYLRTENLWVPIVIHGLYNSFQLVILLLTLVYDLDEEATTAAISLLGILL